MNSSTAEALHSISGKWRSQSQRRSQRSGSLRSGSARDRELDDEEALKWAALEKLPTYNRLRTAILKNVAEEGAPGTRAKRQEVDVTKLGMNDKRAMIENLIRVIDDDNERFLRIVRTRLDSVGIEQPKIEVRFQNLSVSAGVHVGSRALPTLPNYTYNAIESALGLIGLAPTKKRKLDILQGVSGIIKPSRMTLLLGPPSSGKSTLLKALAGKLDPDLKVSGKVTYNGHGFEEFVPQRTAAYISQQDLQSGEMTVRETLDFYGRCQGVGTRYEMLAELSRREKEMGIKPDPDVDAFMKASAVQGQEANVVTDYVLKILGLEICADTLIGDEMRRGISGGQRKRVTTGEMIVGPAKALFMDEISTGLDSSTTFQIVKCLRQFVHFTNGTMIVSLLQPAPETFELFDDIILLSEGQIVYQGPRDLVLDFFEAMGFKCPDRKGTADFLQEVTSRKDQQQYWADRSRPYAFVPVKAFAAAFQQFHVGERLEEELETPYNKARSHPAALVKQKYALSKWDLFRACLSREVLLLKRNAPVYVFKTVQIAILAAITVSVFLRSTLNHRTVEDGNTYMGALFFGLIVVTFNGAADLTFTIVRLPVFYKQRDSYLYPAWAFALPTWLVKIPVSFLEAGIWVVISYYGIGLAPEASRFFRQFLLLVCLHQMSSGLFRMLAAVGRTLIIANTWGNFGLLIITVLGGFILSRENIHPWWIWGYWISPLTYGQNALAANEFLANRWEKPFNGSATQTIGDQVLEGRGQFADPNWYWIGVGALVGFTLLFNILFTWALTYLNPLGKPQAIISEEALEEKQSNLTGAEPSLRTRSLKMRTSLSNQGENALVRSSGFLDGESDRFGAIEEATLAPKRGMVLPFKQLAISFHNVNYYVDMPAEMKEHGGGQDRLQLLHNISGAFRPGVLTALMGVSGAGKTTLMDVLAGRKTGGYIEGDIRISGYPKNQETFARIAGYCEQADIHSPFVTVHESLVYSAWLRLSSDVDPQTRMMFVEEVLDLVELQPLRDAIVGLPGIDGLSVEQRKRLTVAVELVANPSIIFMDEPTSGLDARAAAIVMRTVRNTVDTGRTVVCTIHQPSIDIFEAFDELLLMKIGGQMIYAGPLGRNSQDLVDYLEAVDRVSPITEGENPAAWMLEVTQTAQEGRLGLDFAQVYKESPLYRRNETLIQELSTAPDGSRDLHFETQYSQPFFSQLKACLWKLNLSYWRNPEYNVIRLFFTFGASLLLGTMFWDLGQKRENFQDVLNILGIMFITLVFVAFNNASTIQPVLNVERTVFYRERGAGMYSAIPYAIAQMLVELPYVLLQTVIYSFIVYSMIGFEWTAVKFFWFFLFMYLTMLYMTFFGMFTLAFSPNHQLSAIVLFFLLLVWTLFSGFMITRPSIPIWWRWNYWATPLAWTLYGVIGSQLGDVTTLIKLPDGTEETVKKYLQGAFGFEHDFVGWVALVHVGLVVFFAGMYAVCTKYLNFQRR